MFRKYFIYTTLFSSGLCASTALSTICTDTNNCVINGNYTNDTINVDKDYTTITNNGYLSSSDNGQTFLGKSLKVVNFINNKTIENVYIGKAIYLSDTDLNTFINNGNIKSQRREDITIQIKNKSTNTISKFENYGYIGGTIAFEGGSDFKLSKFENYGYIGGGMKQILGGKPVVYNFNNLGTIDLGIKDNNNKWAHLSQINITIQNYAMTITQNSNTFNSFSGYTSQDSDTSHLVTEGYTKDGNYGGSATIKLKKDSKFLLRIGGDFEFNKDYKIEKLVTNADGNKLEMTYENGGSDVNLFSHLQGANAMYELSKNNDNFRINVDFSKASENSRYINTINSLSNLIILSDYNFYNLGGGISMDTPKKLSPTKRLPKRQSPLSNNMKDDSIKSNYNEKGMFFFAPFVNHSMALIGQKQSGLSYGFVSGSSYNSDAYSIGGHLGFSYGEISGEVISDKQLLGMLGMHSKVNFPLGLYMTLRMDLAYINNNITNTIFKQSDNLNSYAINLGSNIGKVWDLGDNKAIELEGGISYMGVLGDGLNIKNADDVYNNAFLNLLYANISTNYKQYFSDNWLFSAALGAKVLALPLPQVEWVNNDRITLVDVTTNRFYAYTNIGVDYIINDFVRLNLSYQGIFGDTSISNSGFMNVKVWW